jgi:hypothetical protein
LVISHELAIRRMRMANTHLVGSIPRDTPEQVFRTVMEHLDGHVERLPDGETGNRKGWFAPQHRALVGVDGIEEAEMPKTAGARQFPQLRLTRAPDELNIDSLGYEAHAHDSYATFVELRNEGVIPAGVRFQVCFPTPVAVVGAFVERECQRDFEPVYEAAVLRELNAICAVVPHDQLAIQWDVAIETAMLEDAMDHWLGPDVFLELTSRLARLGDAVPSDVQLGYHLCYGYYERRHFKEPADLGLLTRIANAIEQGLSRPLDWIHMPVPVNRRDAAYFEPLTELELNGGELFLGLVHLEDGVAGTEARIRTAQTALGSTRSFGVATECGMGQYPRDALEELLRIHAAVGAEAR